MSVTLRKKKNKSGTFSLYLDIHTDGKRYAEYLKLYLTKDREKNRETKRIAKDIETARKNDFLQSNYNYIPKEKRKINLIEYVENLSQTKSKSKAWNPLLKLLKDYGDIQISKITKNWIEDFQAFLLKKVSRNTAQSYFERIKYSLNQAVNDDLIFASPVRKVKGIKKEQIDRIHLSIDEIEKLQNTPCGNNELKRAFLFSCFSGLRISDIQALTWSKIQDGKLSYKQIKTGKQEYLPMTEAARDILEGDKTNIISMPDTKVFKLPSDAYCNRLLKIWTKTAGIKKRVTFHTGRHTFACRSLDSGVSLYTVSKQLGHSKITMTEIYAKIEDSTLKEAAAMFPKFKTKMKIS